MGVCVSLCQVFGGTFFVFLRNYWNPKELAANICHKTIISTSVFLYLIKAFRNAFLDTVAATSVNGCLD